MKDRFATNRLARTLAICLCALITLPGAVRPIAFGLSGLSAQDPRKPNIEKDSEPPSPPPEKTTKATKRTPPSARGAQAKGRENGTVRKLPSEYTLTFVTNVPDADVAVDGEPLGKAGKNGKLTAKIKPGRHNVTVAHPRYLSKSKPVEIGPGLTEIGFQLEEIPKPAITEVPSTTKAVAPPTKPAIDIDAVFKKFLEGSQPDSVSADEWKEVASQAEKSLASDSTGKLKARMLFAHGQAQYLRGQYTLALVAFNESTQAFPEFAPSFYGAGNTYAATSLLGEAIRQYQRAVELSPSFALAHKALGDTFAKQGNRLESTQSYRRALEAGYDGSDLGLKIARNLMTDQRWTQALAELKELTQKQPTAEAMIAMGECYEAQKNSFSAAMAFYKAKELDDKSAVAYFKLGMILVSRREFEPAKDALQRALALDPAGVRIKLADANRALREASARAHK